MAGERDPRRRQGESPLRNWYDRVNASLSGLFGEPTYDLLWVPPILFILGILVMISRCANG